MAEENPEEIPQKSNSNYHRTELSNSPSESVVVSIHMYCPLSFLLLINTCLTTPILVEILFCRAEGPGPLSLIIGLVTD